MATTTSLITAAPGHASNYCQCVEYVKRKFNLQGPVGNAKDMINSLPKRGFKQTTVQAGAIVIMQPSFPGADRTYGHVGIVESIRESKGRKYITVRGANQAGNRFAEANCNNVSVIGFGSAVDNVGSISFWKR
jgi:surface antigen